MFPLGEYYWLIVGLTVTSFGLINVAAHFIYFVPSLSAERERETLP
jgi:hypothetical protein